MAGLFADTCGDHYATADLDRIWTNVRSGTTVVAGGRCSSNCIKSVGGGVTRGVNASGSIVVVGAAFKPVHSTFTTNYSGLHHPFTFFRGASDFLTLNLNYDGSFWALRGQSLPFADGREAFLTPGGLFAFDVFQFLELKMDIASGDAAIQVNGVEVWSNTGLTLTSITPTWTGVELASAFTATTYLDDVYILDGSGSQANDFLGDVRVEALEPTADGAVTMWALGAGSSKWSAVDDGDAPDDDTSYIKTSTLNDIETNIHEDSSLPTTGTVHFVQVNILAKKDQPGNRLIAAVTRQGGVNYVGADLAVNQDEYTFIHDILEQNPATTAGWTIDEVNDSEWGVKVTT